MILRHRVGDVLQQHRLSAAGRSHDECTGSLANRSQQVHDPHGDWLSSGFEADLLERVDRRQLVEVLGQLVSFDRAVVDLLHVDHARTLASHTHADVTEDLDPLSQLVFFNQRAGDEWVGILGSVVVLGHSQEAIPLGVQFQNPGHQFQFADDFAGRNRSVLHELGMTLSGRAAQAATLATPTTWFRGLLGRAAKTPASR